MGQTVGKPGGGPLGLEELGRGLTHRSYSSSSSEELYSADDETEDESKEKLLPGQEGEEEKEKVGGEEERWWVMGLQVFFPFLIAGFGMVAAGLGKQLIKCFFSLSFF